ncbi:MAG: hypothetical protein EPN38_04535 [Rhodanobacteraceae bacterium]|nr:MAG: hypothetical protein EPN38_04535 [Rhodanobacteraceae bacterium]
MVTPGVLFSKLDDRVAHDQEEGDIAYFNALSFKLEYVTKLVTAGIVACVGDDVDRHRYALEHTLVRADSIGSWVEVLNLALTGPSAQFVLTNATQFMRDLTERVGSDDWRSVAVRELAEVSVKFGIEPQVGAKAALRQFFEIGAAIRNRTRGHGASTGEQCSYACPRLVRSLDLVVGQLAMFKHDWAFLHRNLSGKFRVSPLLGGCDCFDYLRRTRDVSLSDGVYIGINEPVRISLIFTDSDLRDIFVPNGNFKSNSFEALSLITNDVEQKDGSGWSTPPGRLPQSETHGRVALEQSGNAFTNLPPAPTGRIPRAALETRLLEELLKDDRHPIVTLTGPGGIGKTTLALAVLEEVTRLSRAPFDVILWMSSRDIDLLESGPKPVEPRVVRVDDIANLASELLEPAGWKDKAFPRRQYFEQCLREGAAGRTLYVLDNFETLESPADVFNWLDTHVRLPNKVLITTRFRDFVGDYPIDIGGMTDAEASKLIDHESKRLGISQLLTPAYEENVINESDGHPYVIKILLGQVAREQRAIKPERIVASAEHLLAALFERTYENLRPSSQRVFLLLCSWRAFVPSIAVEAVSLRPRNERFDVVGALDELRRFSLIEEMSSTADNEQFVGVPLAAASYGRRKLEVSPFKVAVEEDRKLLMEFGAGMKHDARRGVLPRIDRLVKAASARSSENPAALEEFVPILEYIASRVPKTYVRLADLVLEVDDSEPAKQHAKGYLRKFLETAEVQERLDVWLRLADLCHSLDDAMGEVHALSEAALLPTATPEMLGGIANRINNRIRELKERQIGASWSPEVKDLIERVAQVMERYLPSLSATDYSRLAWLYLNIGHADRARTIARRGLGLDPENEHCLKLVQRLER